MESEVRVMSKCLYDKLKDSDAIKRMAACYNLIVTESYLNDVKIWKVNINGDLEPYKRD